MQQGIIVHDTLLLFVQIPHGVILWQIGQINLVFEFFKLLSYFLTAFIDLQRLLSHQAYELTQQDHFGVLRQIRIFQTDTFLQVFLNVTESLIYRRHSILRDQRRRSTEKEEGRMEPKKTKRGLREFMLLRNEKKNCVAQINMNYTNRLL